MLNREIMTSQRRAINARVAKHLQEALTWCFTETCNNDFFASIRTAKSHDEMVLAVKQLGRKIQKL